MASRLRLPQRAQLTAHLLRCPHTNSYSRYFTLSARLASRRDRRRIQDPQISPRPEPAQSQPPPPTPPPPPPSSPPSSPNAQSLDVLFREKKWPLFGAGIVALGIGLYISLIVTNTLKDTPQDATSSTSPYSSCPPSYHHHNNNDNQPTPTGLPATLDTSTPTTGALTAQAFDKSLNTPEWLMGITGLRATLAQQARGHVLEVAVGTGRNLAHYDWAEVVSAAQDPAEARAARERERITRLLDRHRLGGPTLRDQRREGGAALGSLPGEVLSFTGVDASGDMLGVARDRVRGAVPGLERLMRRRRLEEMPRLLQAGEVGAEGVPVVDALDGRVRLVLGDALRGLPSPPPPPPPPSRAEGTGGSQAPAVAAVAPTKYDTIIQTFGLCSVADPVKLLANMAAKVQPDTGQILLLEHGRGSFEWMNKRLDKAAPKHFQKFGCWWNRDIEQIVREAAEQVPGLEVVTLKRPLWLQAGTTLLIELRVNSQGASRVDQKPASAG
ncbi:hypothetical protein B0I37DRAFT_383026 [Chaetomium sp. MPI-CAGE-AT-0009]|nr:hypothetical protein B0I37DRAFT_383026 [Chaetomium sp. MPI-CAGE-AT-0009]